MKSLLVDALRQSESESPDGSETEFERDGAQSAQRTLPLLETSELTLAADDVLTRTLAGYETQSIEILDPRDVAAVSPPDDEPEDADLETVADGSRVAAATAYRRRRVGAFTPLIAAILCGMSAVGYIGYAGVAGTGAYGDAAMLAAYGEATGATVEHPARPAAFDLVSGALPAVLPLPRVPGASVSPATRPSPAAEATDPAYALLSDAYGAWQQDRVDEAIRLYEAALTVSPRHPNALSGLGALLVHAGKTEEAQSVYARLLSVEPGNATAAAVLLGEADGVARAEAARALLTRYGDSAPLQAALGSALASERRWADARVAFEEAVRLAPERADYAYNLAVVLDRLARYGDARDYYRRALELGADRGPGGDAAIVARLSELGALEGGQRR